MRLNGITWRSTMEEEKYYSDEERYEDHNDEDEEDEECKGSDDDQQEDPQDYKKGDAVLYLFVLVLQQIIYWLSNFVLFICSFTNQNYR